VVLVSGRCGDTEGLPQFEEKLGRFVDKLLVRRFESPIAVFKFSNALLGVPKPFLQNIACSVEILFVPPTRLLKQAGGGQ